MAKSPRRFRIDPVLKRRGPQTSPKIIIWIVCEGKNTEPKYIEDFARHHGNGRVKIEKIDKAGVPLTLVSEAIALKQKLTKKASRKGADSFEKAFQVWAISDVDEHPNLAEAKQIASVNDLNYCISNPCFELWGVLHFRIQDAYIHRHDLQRLLNQLMPNYDHNNKAEFDYDLIKNNYETAKRNAITINNRRIEEDIPWSNTSTNVYLLLDEIIEKGK